MGLVEGENVGPYRIIGQLGQGGMATVYKAFHPQLDRYVAIKMMHQAFLEDDTFVVRFKREAQIVARLEHPHIVPVYDYSEHNGLPYLVMKFIEGRTLKACLKDGALPLNQILHVVETVGGALAYAHQKGVLHRDIKPSNIIIDGENTPYLADFGLARIAQAGESTMSADVLLGTPHYISPEQARGQKELDGRTDIYSLGVVLYEMVVGRVPFSADTPFAIIHDHIYSPLPLPTVVNPDIPPSIENVLLKALAKNPADRFETATDIVDAFRQAIEKDNVTSLSPDRVSVASASLARLREQQEAGFVVSETPESGIPAPIMTSTGARMHIQPSPQARRFWITAGLVALVFVCFLSTAITLSAFDSLSELSALAHHANSPLSQTALLVDVLQLSLTDALAGVEKNPEDAAAYLALARAYWQDGQSSEARKAIQDGFSHADDTVPYLVTASNLADEAAEISEAGAYLLIALNLADGQDIYSTVYDLTGQYFYNLAVSSQDLDVAQTVRSIYSELGMGTINLDIPLVRISTARKEITNDQLRLAEVTLESVDSADQSLAEYHLVRGELNLAQRKTGAAVEEWRAALGTEGVPEWIKERATKLIDSIEE